MYSRPHKHYNSSSARGSRRAQLDEQVGVVRPGARGRQARLGSEGVGAGLLISALGKACKLHAAVVWLFIVGTVGPELT